ncbi:MAG: alpha/beta hydrolase family protein [Anaerobacillus sp.]|uniref:alpha/beta hydrolase family protein n=1 Tax=Anaerobacillus sp. TaxID=1872506 RepID=UPI00391A114F
MNIKEEQVQIKGNVTLGATMSIPKTAANQVPAVLIIAGTGPANRDGNMKKFKLNIYKLIADGLAEAGFISLRYDKRGVGESEGNLTKAGMWELVDDAESALQYLRNHPSVDKERVLVLGHSEGTMLATALNERNPVSGLILLAGAADTLENATKYQRELVYEELLKETGFKGWLIKKLNVIEKAEAKAQKIFSKMYDSDKDVMRVQLVAKMPAKWFREHQRFDLYGAMEKIECPVLAINGEKDVQTRLENVFEVPKLVAGPAEVHVIEGMNHILRNQEGDFPIQKIKKAYQSQSETTLHPELMVIVTNWLKKVYNKE